MNKQESLPSSFRDPSGFIFIEDGVVFRQINQSYKDDYEHLIGSGLYEALTTAGLLLSHEEVDRQTQSAQISSSPARNNAEDPLHYKVIRPVQLPFISYPYEWCYSQLKDAALLTLEVQKKALEHGMVLKDASAFNVQFFNGKPTLIDTLSFEKYQDGSPWIAYKQFCQHFLAPLCLMAHVDLRLNKLIQPFIDGIPLDLAVHLLPKSTMLNVSLLTHLHIHAKSQKQFSKSEAPTVLTQQKLGRQALAGIIDSLESSIRGLKLKQNESFWRNYYGEHNYSDKAFAAKKAAIEECLTTISPEVVWDLGANVGLFSRLASKRNLFTISADMDALSVETNYLKARDEKDERLLPLIIDLSSPTPPLGWANSERMSFVERGPADVVFALALIHHLAIGNNVPLPSVAKFMASAGKHLIIEFVPKSDSQVKELLRSRQDIFANYDEPGFESAFSEHFKIERKWTLEDSDRTLYLMRRERCP